MNKVILLILFMIMAVNVSAVWTDADSIGQESKNLSNDSYPSYVPSIALDSNDYPHVTWFSSENGNMEIYYMK